MNPQSAVRPPFRRERARRLWRLAAYASLPLLLSLWMYQPAWHGAPLWDDNDALFSNPLITSPLSPLSRIWFSHAAPDYWPLHYTFFWGAYRLWGAWTLPYHLINILLHSANTVIIALLLRHFRVKGAYLCALLFCAHPVNAEAVAWICQFKTVASTALCGAAWLALLASLRSRQPRWFYVTSVLLFAAALLVKTGVVFAPIAFGASVYWLTRDRTKAALYTLPFLVLAGAVGAVAVCWYAPNAALPPGDAVELGPWSIRLARTGWNLASYLREALWPNHLMFIYPQRQLNGIWAYAPLLGFGTAALALYSYRRRYPELAAALGFYVLALAPVLGLVTIYFMHYADTADHWQYAALPALVVAAALVALKLTKTWAHPYLPAALSLPLILTLALATRSQAALYESEESLWREAAELNPSAWIARNNLGKALLARHAYQEAEAEFAEAIRLKPDFRSAFNNLGASYLEQGKLVPAVQALEKALELWPGYAVAASNLGVALTRQGRYPEAAEALRRATELDPDDATYHKNLGFALQRLHQLDAAATEYRAAVSLSPQADYWSDLGQILREAQRFDEAQAALQEALRLNPKHGLAMANLGFIAMARDHAPEALRWLRQAVTASPESASIHLALADTLIHLGELTEARDQLNAALAIDPQTSGTSFIKTQLEQASGAGFQPSMLLQPH